MSRELKELQLQVYIKQGNAEGIKELVNEGEGVNLNMTTIEGTMLMLAAKNSRWDIVELLIDLGADIYNTYEADAWKILHYAARNPWVPVVEIFVYKQLDLEVKTADEETPLMLAAQWNRCDPIKLLVNAGVNINARDVRKQTVLHHATYKGFMKLVQYLVRKNADINAQCENGFTPLHVALRNGSDIELIGFFVRAGANCHLEDKDGITAFNLLCKKKLLGPIRVAIEKGGYVSSCDYPTLVEVPLLKNHLLQKVRYCSQSIINKYNNKDLPDLYKVSVASDVLPPIQKMKILDKSAFVDQINRVVEQDIVKRGFCNLVQPLLLGVMCIKAFLEHVEKAKIALNQTTSSGVQRGLKRASVQKYSAKKRLFREL